MKRDLKKKLEANIALLENRVREIESDIKNESDMSIKLGMQHSWRMGKDLLAIERGKLKQLEEGK